MHSIRDFYRELNLSVSGEEVRKRWEAFRKDVTGFVMDGFIKGGATVVIGAGNMNDIDFKTIADASTNIVLADIDTKTLSENTSGRIETAEIDFGCIDGINQVKNVKELLEFLRTESPGVRSSIGSRVFSNIIVSPFYTQLVLPWVFVMFPDIQPASEIAGAALELAGKIIRQSNEYIRKIAADGCRLCLWTDILEYDANDPAFTDIKNNIADSSWMDAFLEQYTNEWGYGLGTYGHLEMEEHLVETDYKWLIWPFDKDRRLIVKITSGFPVE